MEYYFSPGECRCLVKRSVLVLCFGGAERILGVCVCVLYDPDADVNDEARVFVVVFYLH